MMVPHSCEKSDLALDDPHIAYVYRPRPREFAILICKTRELVEDHHLLMTVSHCPWCGETLPGSLRVQLFDTIEEVLGHDEFSIFDDYPKIPKEFGDDSWWRSREIPADVGGRCLKDERTYDNDAKFKVDNWYDDRPGLRRPHARLPHMCDFMQAALEGYDNMTFYLPQTREYGVRILELSETVDYQPIRIMPFHYCPWCGDKLPSSLRDAWEARLRAEGLEPDDPNVPTNLPEHWGTDQWWRAEGL